MEQEETKSKKITKTRIILLIIGGLLILGAGVYLAVPKLFNRKNIARVLPILDTPLEVAEVGEHSYKIFSEKIYKIKGEDITLELAGAGFLILFPETDDIWSSHITVAGKNVTYEFVLNDNRCNKKNVMFSDDVGSSVVTDCEITINKQPIKQDEATLSNLRPTSIPITGHVNFFNLEGDRFIYLIGNFFQAGRGNITIDIVTNFGSYYAWQAPCAVGQTLGTIKIGPENMNIYCGDNKFTLDVSYENGVDKWPAKILYFEPVPSMFTHGPIFKKLGLVTSCKDIYQGQYSYNDLSPECVKELEKMLQTCRELPPKSEVADSCFNNVAIRSGDFSLCDVIYRNSETKNKCFFKIAVDSKNPDVCQKIDSNYKVPFLDGSGRDACGVQARRQ